MHYSRSRQRRIVDVHVTYNDLAVAPVRKFTSTIIRIEIRLELLLFSSRTIVAAASAIMAFYACIQHCRSSTYFFLVSANSTYYRNGLDPMYVVSLAVSVCSEGWVTRGSYITAVNTECVAELVYTATLVRPDYVTFEYQKDVDTYFSFEVSL